MEVVGARSGVASCRARCQFAWRRNSLRLRRPAASVGVEQGALEREGDAESDRAETKRRVAIFVEPSPFSHVSGMKNRFLRLIEDLATSGDDVRGDAMSAFHLRYRFYSFSMLQTISLQVLVITPDRNPPEEYGGARVSHNSPVSVEKEYEIAKCPLRRFAGDESDWGEAAFLFNSYAFAVTRSQPADRKRGTCGSYLIIFVAFVAEVRKDN